MKFIKKHKVGIIISVICLILVVLAAVAIYSIFNPNSSKTVYGDRLEGEPEISNEVIDGIITSIKSNDFVNDISYKKNVVVLKFFIDVKADTKISKPQELGSTIIESLGTDVTNFFDVEIYLTQKEGESSDYPAIGYHSKNASKISWVINKAGEENE